MHLSPLAWQSLTVQYPFKQRTQPSQFFDFQPQAKQALTQFLASDFGSALILKTETFSEFLSEIVDYCNPNKHNIILKSEFDRNQLFGYRVYLEKASCIETVDGIIAQANQAILILNLRSLISDMSQWDKLKQALLFREYQPLQLTPIPDNLPPIHSAFKLLLVGSREEIAALVNYDDSLYQFSHYSELDSYLSLNEQNIQQWGDYVQNLAQKYINKAFSSQALNQLYQNYIRESENKQIISISPTLLKKHILGIQYFYPEQTVFSDIQDYFNYLEQQSSTLNQYVVQDILNNQLYIETEGEEIGQINGLSVVEFDGIPYSFGEPLRISCNVQYGDGEISDIERKVELAGNIHSKGVIIAQSCLANLLEFPTQLPFSASVAFEQSYGEIDGDSSSLAIFCVLISALTKLALPQTIAVTGSIDQFGNVLSVGGVNQKIEGFFQICNARGLTGEQGVIIPAVCVSHLSLKPEVLSAIKAKQFKIWAVADVFEALEILLNHCFYDEELKQTSDKPSLFSLVHRYIEESQQNEATSGPFWRNFCKYFAKD